MFFPPEVGCEDMIERFKAMEALAEFFFADQGIITQFYADLKNWCIDNRKILEAKVALDPKLIARTIRVNPMSCPRSGMIC